LVDGQVGGKVEVLLLPGDLRKIFAVTFFTNSGKPRTSVPSVHHQALTSAGDKFMFPFFLIENFKLDVDHWTHTNVGAQAL
jgi:hypothetical protein